MKRWKKISIGVLILVLLALLGAGNYFYNYAFVPSEKDFIAEPKDKSDATQSWFTDADNRAGWQLVSEDGLQLSAIYLPAEIASGKTAILAHGYMSKAESMGKYAKMFHDLGYNVLVPDARGHGKSDGDYIGFGWDERRDMLGWIGKVLENNGMEETVVLYGISMGGATVMMTSGEELPKNVKAIIEDCGYASVEEELSYQLKEMFGLPGFPLIPVTNLVTKVRAGYFFTSASSVRQLKKNKTPILFIHGTKDDFVPFEMLEEVYQATDAPKEKYEVAGAGHAEAYDKAPETYKAVAEKFLNAHLKEVP